MNSKLIPEIFKDASPVLFNYVSRHPEYLEELLRSTNSKPQMAVNSFAKVLSVNGKSPSDAKKALRLFKYNALTALSALYLRQKISAMEFCDVWSRTADICCEKAFERAFETCKSRYGDPVCLDTDGKKIPFRFCVLAAGKLGSNELNLSSDIDLIFIYDTDSGYTNKEKQKSIFEFASALATGFIELVADRDENGFCFRVDTNLRPEGNRGALVNSVDAIVRFYETWGTEMERLMLIRARPVAGDISLGEEFLKRVRPFIYRKNIDITTLEKIRDTKAKIRKEARGDIDKGINIKLGDGGIREVEFIVQSIQLVYGGKDPSLTGLNTLDALKAIKKRKYLPPKQCEQLSKAYIFLRNLENMLQMREEKQTHTLPVDRSQWCIIARMAGYKKGSAEADAQALFADLGGHLELVKQYFSHIFETDFERHGMEEAIFTNISTCVSQEEEIDSLAWFKKEETKKIQYKDLEENLSPEEVSTRLSLVAEVVLSEAYKIASGRLREIHGQPMSGTGPRMAELSIIGMGKLGGREIDYASDLDLMFIFSADGETTGPKKITNQEYFTKLSQRIMSLITLPTRYGRAYQIDADLRPSGRAGILVSSLKSFRNYHNIEAQLWERQALIKARAVAGDPKFSEEAMDAITELCYGLDLPQNLAVDIAKLRSRMETEKAKETATKINLKLGVGGLMDIEMVIQLLQLKNGRAREAVRKQNILTALAAIVTEKLIDETDAAEMVRNYLFLKRLLSRIRLFSNFATDHLDMNSDKLSQIAKTLGYGDKEMLAEDLYAIKERNRIIFEKYFG